MKNNVIVDVFDNLNSNWREVKDEAYRININRVLSIPTTFGVLLWGYTKSGDRRYLSRWEEYLDDWAINYPKEADILSDKSIRFYHDLTIYDAHYFLGQIRKIKDIHPATLARVIITLLNEYVTATLTTIRNSDLNHRSIATPLLTMLGIWFSEHSTGYYALQESLQSWLFHFVIRIHPDHFPKGEDDISHHCIEKGAMSIAPYIYEYLESQPDLKRKFPLFKEIIEYRRKRHLETVLMFTTDEINTVFQKGRCRTVKDEIEKALAGTSNLSIVQQSIQLPCRGLSLIRDKKQIGTLDNFNTPTKWANHGLAEVIYDEQHTFSLNGPIIDDCIPDKRIEFKPRDKWGVEEVVTKLTPFKDGLFHYSPDFKIALTEYQGGFYSEKDNVSITESFTRLVIRLSNSDLWLFADKFIPTEKRKYKQWLDFPLPYNDVYQNQGVLKYRDGMFETDNKGHINYQLLVKSDVEIKWELKKKEWISREYDKYIEPDWWAKFNDKFKYSILDFQQYQGSWESDKPTYITYVLSHHKSDIKPQVVYSKKQRRTYELYKVGDKVKILNRKGGRIAEIDDLEVSDNYLLDHPKKIVSHKDNIIELIDGTSIYYDYGELQKVNIWGLEIDASLILIEKGKHIKGVVFGCAKFKYLGKFYQIAKKDFEFTINDKVQLQLIYRSPNPPTTDSPDIFIDELNVKFKGEGLIYGKIYDSNGERIANLNNGITLKETTLIRAFCMNGKMSVEKDYLFVKKEIIPSVPKKFGGIKTEILNGTWPEVYSSAPNCLHGANKVIKESEYIEAEGLTTFVFPREMVDPSINQAFNCRLFINGEEQFYNVMHFKYGQVTVNLEKGHHLVTRYYSDVRKPYYHFVKKEESLDDLELIPKLLN